MKILSKSEMKKINGGLAYSCCAYTFDPGRNNEMHYKCGITIEEAETRVEDETNNGWFSYYTCGNQQGVI